MNKLRVTVGDVMDWGPCGFDGEDDGENYTRARVESLWAGREDLTAPEILDLDIPPEDRLWCVLREELIDARTLRLFACGEAELLLDRAAGRGEEIDPRSRDAIRVSRRYARGEATVDELIAARAAACDASCDAAWDAARDAASAAACDAARDASCDAAWDAAWDAARDAAWTAQVKRLRKMIEEEAVRGR